MIFFTILLVIAVVVCGIVIVEKKRKNGVITYPLWRGNTFVIWCVFVLLTTLLTGAFTLPRFVGLAMHGVAAEAMITELNASDSCRVTYNYKAAGVEHTDSERRCGLHAGDSHKVYYDAKTPENSTLYLPENALKDEILAMLCIALCFSTFLIIWLKSTYVIGSKI